MVNRVWVDCRENCIWRVRQKVVKRVRLVEVGVRDDVIGCVCRYGPCLTRPEAFETGRETHTV